MGRTSAPAAEAQHLAPAVPTPKNSTSEAKVGGKWKRGDCNPSETAKPDESP